MHEVLIDNKYCKSLIFSEYPNLAKLILSSTNVILAFGEGSLKFGANSTLQFNRTKIGFAKIKSTLQLDTR